MNYELIIRREETFKGYLTRPPVCYNITVSSLKAFSSLEHFFYFSFVNVDRFPVLKLCIYLSLFAGASL